MKFQQKYPKFSPFERIDCEYSWIMKDALGQCAVCAAHTTWVDMAICKHICSEECEDKFWNMALAGAKSVGNEDEILRIKRIADLEKPIEDSNPTKDIIVVVRDQLDYVQKCVESVRRNTKNFNLMIWDNGSKAETKSYLEALQIEYQGLEDPDWTLEIWSTENNLGFIEPNNRLAQVGTGEYIILLNSDVKVMSTWDTTMTSFLQNNKDVAQVGYSGGQIDETGKGVGAGLGYDIDYVSGSCCCISRATYNEFGLFNKQLSLAYFEDSDLSLRLKEAGYKVYALHGHLIYHYQNKTINTVIHENELDLNESFKQNHEYMKQRWEDYIKNKRVLKCR